jgi:hypothetical protein
MLASGRPYLWIRARPRAAVSRDCASKPLSNFMTISAAESGWSTDCMIKAGEVKADGKCDMQYDMPG